MATPAEVALGVIDDAGRAGAKAAVVVSGGFSEIGRQELEEGLIKTARRYGIRVLGPNCIGVYNAFNGLDTMFLPAEKAGRPPAGPIAFLSQSGAVMTAALDWAAGEYVGVGIAVNFGNRADVTEADFLEFLEGDERIKVVALYLEGFRRRSDVARFLQIVKKMDKPIVVYKAGRGNDAQRAVASHTAAMAGRYELYKGLFRQTGVVEAEDLIELFDMAKALALYDVRAVRNVLVVTSSGGMGVQIVDALNAVGLSVPELPREAQRELKSYLPPVAVVSNPVDLTGGGRDEHFRAALDIGLRFADAVVVAALIHPPGYSENAAWEILQIYERYKKPVVVVSFGRSPQTKALEEALKKRLVVVDTPKRAAKALLAVAFYSSKINRRSGERGNEHKSSQGVYSGISPASGGVSP